MPNPTPGSQFLCRVRRLLLPGLALLALTLLLALPRTLVPVAAQTPVPTVTPTRTPSELIGVNPQQELLLELFTRFGGWGTLGVLGLMTLVWFVVALTKKAGETLVEYLNRVFVKGRLDRRAEKIESQTRQRETAQAQARQLEHGLAAYLQWLQDEYQHLPIIPIKTAERLEQLALTTVYVPLRVVERTQIEGFRKLTLGEFDPEGEYRLREQALADLERSQRVYRLLSNADQLLALETDGKPVREQTTTRLLLVGDAGSGKTTTLHYGALILAHDYQQGTPTQAQATLDLHVAHLLLPIYIRLTLVATYVREAYQRASPDELPALHGAPSHLLLDWLRIHLQSQVKSRCPTLPVDLLDRQLTDGHCLFLLDGLDETGDATERAYMQRLIVNLVQDYPHQRYLVASRPFDDLRLPGFDERHLSPMNSEEMQCLLRNWFGAVRTGSTTRQHQESVDEQVTYLWDILERNARLFEMATNPLLLTSMALLVQTGVGLPRERAELYNRLVYLLLETWRILQVTGGVPGRDSGRPVLYGGEENVSSVQRRLQELAAWMQEQQRREVRLDEAQRHLRPIYQELMGWHAEQCDDYICRLLESLALESGLVQKRDRGYSFAHYTLQEYLTARAYDQRAEGVAQLMARYAQPRWRETILLAVGHWATSGDPDHARQFLRKLLATGDAQAVLLAGAALDDADADRVPELAPLRTTTAERLHELAFQPQRCPDPRMRNTAAELLDRLEADQRPELHPDHPRYWADRIEPGPFVMGDDQGKYDDEKPAFVYRITRPYALAHYPVTNRQYLCFLEDLERQGRADEAQQRRPREWPGRRYRAGTGNHPVVNVDWYDATAFAAWANATWLTDEQRARGEQIRLPTEPEWERAAAYPLTIPPDNPGGGRGRYPWGDTLPDLTDTSSGSITGGIRGNTKESGIGGTSVVGIFPDGAAACGAEDLAGNVWEWCSTRYQSYPLAEEVRAATLETIENQEGQTFVVRGGAYWNDLSDARCGFRSRNHPRFVYHNVGVRLARLFSL